MRFVRFGLVVSAILSLGIAEAAAQSGDAPRVAPTFGQVTLTPHIGTEIPLAGQLTKSAAARVSPFQPFSNIVFDNPGTVSVRALKFNDLYGAPLEAGIGVAYGVSNSGEVFGSIRYLHAAGQKTSVGSISVVGSVGAVGYGAGAALIATPDNFSASSAEIGYRHFIATSGPLLPYVAGMAGVTRTGAIDAQLFVDGGANGELKAGRVKIYDGTIAATSGLQIGVTYVLAPQASVGFETGVRYDAKLKGDDTMLGVGDGGLARINNTGTRWSAPIRLTARLAF
jgi:hypothetical protein